MGNKTISIIGLGWLGLPLARQLQKEGFRVKGSVTSVAKLTALKNSGLEVHQLQLNPEPVGNLTALLQADTLVINVPPKAGSNGAAFHPEQVKHVTAAIRQSSVKHVIYVSSTSIYPEAYQIVVEDDVVTPEQAATPALVEAEQFVQTLAPDRTVTVVRCGGLMGYNRIPGKYVGGKLINSGAVPVNYLHQDDAVGILTTLIQQPIPGTFNAVAPEHPTRKAIYQKSCSDFGYDQPNFIQPEKPVPYKVVSIERLLKATNYGFKYPDPLQFFYLLGSE